MTPQERFWAEMRAMTAAEVHELAEDCVDLIDREGATELVVELLGAALQLIAQRTASGTDGRRLWCSCPFCESP